MSLNENIQKQRLEKGLTLEELSKKIKISTWSLERYESGELVIPKINLKKIADGLDTTINNLKEEKDNRVLVYSVEEVDFKDEANKSEDEITENKDKVNDEVIDNIEEVVNDDREDDMEDNINDVTMSEEEFIEKYRSLDNIDKNKIIEFLNVINNV